MLPRLPARRFFLLLLILIAVYALAALVLPSDHPVRSAVRFNVGKLSTYVRKTDDSWVFERQKHRVEFTSDVGLLIKTGYGTQTRLLAQMEAMSLSGKKRDIVVVGDFNATLDGSWTTVEVHNVVAPLLDDETVVGEGRDTRIEEYKELKTAIDAKSDVKAQEISSRVGWHLDALKFIPGLELAYQRAPSKKWWIIMDDDTFLIKPSLEKVLSHLDPTQDHYVGNAIGDWEVRFAHGGSAMAISKRTMQRLFEHPEIIQTAKIDSLNTTWGDKVVASMLMKIGVYVNEDLAPYFNGEPPLMTKITANNFCRPLVSFHALKDAERMLLAGKIFKKEPKTIFWGQLWGLYEQPDMSIFKDNPVRPDWDYVGRADTTLEDVASTDACRKMCDLNTSCLAWTWEQETKKCHIAPWVVLGSEAKGKSSGLHFERAQSVGEECGARMMKAGCFGQGGDCHL